jgi:hypothetical protein
MVTMEPIYRSDEQASPITPPLPKLLQPGDILSFEDGTLRIIRCQWQAGPSATLTFRAADVPPTRS